MKSPLLIAGSGKMAYDIGLYFLSRGYSVCWVSNDTGRLAAIETRVRRAAGRLLKHSPETAGRMEIGFHLYDDADIPPAETIIECTTETLESKQKAFGRLERVISQRTLAASSSSSILPREIHPSCVGIHFFYPIELTRFAEVVFSEDCSRTSRQSARCLLAENGIDTIEQTEKSAFAVNRLLLPLQAECFRMLSLGYPASLVDEASASSLSPMGQLQFIDQVGIDVIHSSVRNYQNRMPQREAKDYTPLVDGLSQLVALGKCGRKNKDGLLQGSPLPWRSQRHESADMEALSKSFLYIFINTCYHFLESEYLDQTGLDLALSRIFAAECSLEEIVRRENPDAIVSGLTELYNKTGLSYFLPVQKTLQG